MASRRIKSMSDVARELGVKEVMKFDSASDPNTGLSLTGVTWQQHGTGDVFLSIAILYGLFVGNGGGAANAVTDKAGLLIRAQ